jgi:putative endonuclease
MSRVSDKPYFVYVLWSPPSGQRFYIGISEDVPNRLRQHNDGRSRWSSRYSPWNVAFVRECSTYTEARKLENDLKRQKGGAGFFAKTGLDPMAFRRG